MGFFGVLKLLIFCTPPSLSDLYQKQIKQLKSIGDKASHYHLKKKKKKSPLTNVWDPEKSIKIHKLLGTKVNKIALLQDSKIFAKVHWIG